MDSCQDLTEKIFESFISSLPFGRYHGAYWKEAANDLLSTEKELIRNVVGVPFKDLPLINTKEPSALCALKYRLEKGI